MTAVKAFRICCLAISVAFTAPAISAADKPQRVASLNVCTDQLVLALLQRPRIASITFLAVNADTSYYHQKAHGIAINYGTAEEILGVKPDLIVAGSYTTPATTALLRKLGLRVELFEPDDSIKQMRDNNKAHGGSSWRNTNGSADHPEYGSSIGGCITDTEGSKASCRYLPRQRFHHGTALDYQ